MAKNNKPKDEPKTDEVAPVKAGIAAEITEKIEELKAKLLELKADHREIDMAVDSGIAALDVVEKSVAFIEHALEGIKKK